MSKKDPFEEFDREMRLAGRVWLAFMAAWAIVAVIVAMLVR